MKNKVFAVLVLLLAATSVSYAFKEKTYKGEGEVNSVLAAYNQISIHHGAIAGFSAEADTEFTVSSPDLLKNLSRRDLVRFEFDDKSGKANITKIEKYGIAPEKDDRLMLGKAVQGALEATGGAAKTVTSPIAPAHEVVGSAMDATTNATGTVLDDASTEVKQKF